MDTFVGFDSAWTDNPKRRGAICAVQIESGSVVNFREPILASFDQALEFVDDLRGDGILLIALDQPTIVKNLAGCRPVERPVRSFIGWLGGGVQPSSRNRKGMFCDESPIWRFLERLNAVEDPELARIALHGLHLLEVYPALALVSLDSGFFGRKASPKYNPERKNFRIEDWNRVKTAVAREARLFRCEELAAWCEDLARVDKPRKYHQDMLDAAICLLVALRWRLLPSHQSLWIGDLRTGYMVTPCTQQVRDYLTIAARKQKISLDGAQVL